MKLIKKFFMPSNLLLFSGTSHPQLAQEVAALLNIKMGKADFHLFPDQEIFVQVQEPVEGRHAFVIQSMAHDPNLYLMEIFLLLDALKRAGAASITVVLPYYGYARQDRIDKPGEPIAAKLIANLLTNAGASHIIALDLHSEQIEGFFDIPMQHLLSRHLLIGHCSQLDLHAAVVVSPDKGGIKLATDYSKQLNIPMALIDKERLDAFHVEMHLFVGEVKGKTVLLTDDMCSTGGTLINAAKACTELGAARIIAVVGHGLFTGNALESIQKSPIEIILTTNSVPFSQHMNNQSKIKVISIAPLLADAIQRRYSCIHFSSQC
jgi:ribose-phosphate pyrophosphokinase